MNIQILTAFTIIHLACIGAIYHFSIQALIAWLVLHILFIGFGIVIGFHRGLSHKSYLPHPALEFILSLLGTLSWQGGPLFWASVHRAHHQFSEKYGDPHDANKGFFWSHFGWMLFKKPNGYSINKIAINSKDLLKKKHLVFLERNYFSINLIFIFIILLPTLFYGRLDLFFWCIPVRIVSVWHATWMVNSYAHGAGIFGRKIHNSYLLSILTFGEGYHKNHHDDPTNPNTSKDLTQVDPAYLSLKLFEKLSLVDLGRLKKIRKQKAS